jgi:hypothetical protein
MPASARKKKRPGDRTGHDADLQKFHEALAPYATEHPRARIEVQRRNNAIVNVRIIDPDFHATPRHERDALVWPLLEPLPEEVLTQLYLLILLTPQEAKTSVASFEFDHPARDALDL